MLSDPGLIVDLTLDDVWAKVTRGEGTIDPREVDISACSNARGRKLLATEHLAMQHG
jgi:hypothetical protein